VTAFLEKTPNPVTNQINAGCYVFRREVIGQIPAGRRVSVERETFPALVGSGELVMGYLEPAYWLDVGTPQAFVRDSSGPRCVSPRTREASVGGDSRVCTSLHRHDGHLSRR
jgi:mannose-1-phosphate guanylyltransferase